MRFVIAVLSSSLIFYKMKISTLAYIFILQLCLIFPLQANAEKARASAMSSKTGTEQMLQIVTKFASKNPKDKENAIEFKKMLTALPHDTMVYKAIITYGRGLMAKGRQANVFELFTQLISLEEIDKEDKQRVKFTLDVYILLGAAASEIGMQNVSMEYYTRGRSIAEDTQDARLSRFLNNIGVVYFNMGDMPKAKEYFQKALALNKQNKLNYDIFLNYNNLSEIDMEEGKPDDALNNALLAMQYLNSAKNNNDPVIKGGIYYIHTQIANLYLKKKDYNMAKSYIVNAITQQRKGENNSDLFESCMVYSELFRQTAQLDSAKVWVLEARKSIENLGNVLLECRALDQLSKIEEEQGLYQESLKHSRESATLRDSLQLEENRNRMEQCQKIYEVERKNNSNTSFMARQDPVVVFSILSLIVLILVFILAKWALDKRKLSKTLRAKTELSKEVQQLHSKQLEAARLKHEEMKEALDQTHRQLTNFTMQKLRNTEQQADIMHDMRKLLVDINPRSKELREDLQKIISKLSRYRATDDWTEFQYYFERVNPVFYKNLLEKHPDVTEKEKRLCALLSLGLNTKEIAQITFREVRSIESSRTRLRKKLGLSTEDDLNSYCREFADKSGVHPHTQVTND